MMSKADFTSHVETAFDDLNTYLRSSGGHKPALLLPDDRTFIDVRRHRAEDFATVVGGALVGLCDSSSFPTHGEYVSWLMMVPRAGGLVPRIVIDSDRINDWARERQSPSADIQAIRAIFHEVGHIRRTPRLLSTTPSTTEGHCDLATPEEEEHAWIYAMTIQTILLSDYSWRMSKFWKSDNTPRVSI